jgi:hypothetical protein
LKSWRVIVELAVSYGTHIAPFYHRVISSTGFQEKYLKNFGVSPMKEKRVEEILLPFRKGVPLCPSVTMSDKITHAVELMVNNNLKFIAVVRNERPIGMVCLEDAFKKLGLCV